MNRNYKTVFNRRLNVWQAVSEIATPKGKASCRSVIAMAALTLPLVAQATVLTYVNGAIVSSGIDLGVNDAQLEVVGTDVATQSGAIFETGGVRPLEKIGTGTLNFTGTNTYTGTTTISAGTLNLSGGSAISDNSAVVVASGATLGVLNNEAIGSLAGNAGSQVILTGILTAGGNNSSTTFAGAISGNGGLTKTGTGTLTLTGNSTFGGFLITTGGTLAIQGGAQVSNHAGFIGVLAGNNSTVTVSGSGSSWTPSNGLDVGGAGAGTLNIQNGGKVTTSLVFFANGSGSGQINLDGTSGARGVLETDRLHKGSGTATLNWNGGILRATRDIASFLGNLTSSDIDIQSGGAFVDSNGFNIGIATALDGVGGLTKQGSGTLTLTGANVYTGDTTISAGSLQIGNGGTTGSITGNVVNNATLVFNRSDALTYAGNITGTGDLVKSGTGTLTLTGNSSIGGELRADAGSLVISGGGTMSSDSGNIVFGANVTVSGSNSRWSSTGEIDMADGELSIENGATVSAAGLDMGIWGGHSTLNLNGTSGARGVLEVNYIDQNGSPHGINWNGGIVRASSNEANFIRDFLGSSIDIKSGGAYFDTNGFNVGVAANLAGVGGLTKQGTGTLTLSGASTYGGGTTVESGTLALSGAGALSSSGAVTIANGASFDISAASGNRTIGALSGDGSVALGANGLTTGDTSSTVYAGIISGAGGSLVKQGSGTLILSGINTYSGNTTVNAGTLSVNGSIVGNTTVNAGGALGGSGSVGTVTLASGGALAPGNSIGTLTVNGDLTFGSGSTYRVEVNAAGASDKTVVNGNVTLAGTVDVRAGAGTYAPSTTYTILTHTGTRTGVFDSVTSNLAFLTPTLSYAANAVELNLARNNVSFASVADTRNQSETAGGVEALGSGTVYTAVAGLSARQARIAYDTLSGTQHAASSQIAMNMGRSFSGALMNRAAIAGGRFSGASSLRYASMDLSGISSLQGLFGSPHNLNRNLSPTPDSSSLVSRLNAASGNAPTSGVWFQVLGGKGDVKGDGNGSGSDYSSTGFLAGYDTQLSQDWLIGVAVGYGKTQWDADMPATGNVDTPYAALYGRYTSGPWQIRMNGGFADNRFDTTRTITLGAGSSQVRSKHNGKEWSAAAEAEYALTKAQGWEVKPLMAIRYAYLDEDGFTESGSPAALRIRGRSTQQVNLGVGSRFIKAFGNDNGSIELRAMVTHLAGDNDSPVTASFVGSTSIFNVDGTPLKRTALVLGAGVSHQIANRLSAFADIGYETRGSGQSNAAAAIGMQYRW